MSHFSRMQALPKVKINGILSVGVIILIKRTRKEESMNSKFSYFSIENYPTILANHNK